MAAMNARQEQPAKREGNIADAFASMSGKGAEPLPDRFRELKLSLVAGREDQITSSWKRLLKVLKTENETIARAGSSIIPIVNFSNLNEDLVRLKDEIRKRGAAVIRGVIPESEARSYKFEIEDYVKQNPQTKGFPADNPQVIELYWSAPQLRARTHPNLLAAQTTLMTSLWHTDSSSSVPISLSTPLSYADRLRIRQPGDAQFALGPHQDGGSLERWEREGYGGQGVTERSEGSATGVYDAVFAGVWEHFDPFDATPRVTAITNRYNGIGACSMFRAFQGWLAMSRCGPGQGTLLVNPLLRESSTYALLRPFFRPLQSADVLDREEFLNEDNWVFTAGEQMTSEIQGAIPGHGQEFPEGMHPHLELDKTMVHIPEVKPGDFVVWHCDTIHAVDKEHKGTADSSVLYIPVCPTTEENALYVARQRAAFLAGTSGPDFGGGEGESRHVGRLTEAELRESSSSAGLQSLGLERITAHTNTLGATKAINAANVVLGY